MTTIDDNEQQLLQKYMWAGFWKLLGDRLTLEEYKERVSTPLREYQLSKLNSKDKGSS